MDNKNKETAEKIFKAIKKMLADARKYNKEKGFSLNNRVLTFSRREQMVDIAVWDNTSWKGDKKVINYYGIRLNNKEVAKCNGCYDVQEVFSELRNLLNAQKKVKGWGGLNFMDERITLEGYSWEGYSVSAIPKVCLSDAPCPEYKSLMNFINKYGTRKYGSPMKLGNYELFSAAKGGKRGYLWDEHGERIFLDNKPKTSARLLEELRKARGTKDTMVCEIGEEDYIDPEEQRASSYYEVECEGEHRRYLRVVIKTPTGKVKYDKKLY